MTRVATTPMAMNSLLILLFSRLFVTFTWLAVFSKALLCRKRKTQAEDAALLCCLALLNVWEPWKARQYSLLWQSVTGSDWTAISFSKDGDGMTPARMTCLMSKIRVSICNESWTWTAFSSVFSILPSFSSLFWFQFSFKVYSLSKRLLLPIKESSIKQQEDEVSS